MGIHLCNFSLNLKLHQNKKFKKWKSEKVKFIMMVQHKKRRSRGLADI